MQHPDPQTGALAPQAILCSDMFLIVTELFFKILEYQPDQLFSSQGQKNFNTSYIS